MPADFLQPLRALAAEFFENVIGEIVGDRGLVR
jgi:hypothetical protein